MRNREYLISLHRYFEKNKFDFDEYNHLKDAISKKEQDLLRLRDPLQLQLPIEQLLKQRHPEEPDFTKDKWTSWALDQPNGNHVKICDT